MQKGMTRGVILESYEYGSKELSKTGLNYYEKKSGREWLGDCCRHLGPPIPTFTGTRGLPNSVRYANRLSLEIGSPARRAPGSLASNLVHSPPEYEIVKALSRDANRETAFNDVF
jgi:hypothetical protein